MDSDNILVEVDKRWTNNDLIVCVIFNSQRDSILLIDQNLKKNTNLKQNTPLNEPYSYWFPYLKSNSNETSVEAAKRLLSTIEVFSTTNNINNSETLENYFDITTILRIHSNHLLPLVTNSSQDKPSRVIYVLCNSTANLTRDNQDKIENWCSNLTFLKWMNLNQMKQASKRHELLGIEPILFFKEIYDLKNSVSNCINVNFFFHEPKMIYIEPSASVNVNLTPIEQLVLSAKFSRDIQDQLYALFYAYAYPCDYLNLAKFKLFIQKLLKIQALDTSINSINYFKNYFYSFDLFQKSILTYNDLLLGLAAMEPGTQHGGTPAEQRCRYIFRYYTFNDSITFTDDLMQQQHSQQQPSSLINQVMNFEQFKNLIKDINTLKKMNSTTSDEKSLEIEAINAFKLFGLNSPNDLLSLSDFLIGVGQLKFRGTSVLFRLNRPIADILSNMYDMAEITNAPDLLLYPLNHGLKLKNLNKSILPKGDLTIATKSRIEKRRDDYELATHTVRVKRTGDITDNMRIDRIWDLDGATTPNIMLKDAQFQLTSNNLPHVTVRHQIERITSGEFFNQDTKPNQMLYGLRYFERAIKETKEGYASKEGFSWGKLDMGPMANCLIGICRQLVELISAEDRLLQIKAPCYILGDLHGNYNDLISFEKTLWRMGPKLTPASFLFLGDYVDRGPHGVEVVSYLFSQKLLAPEKFFLLRGNHELRSIQRMFHFYDECINKFGSSLGEVVWEEINNVFDVLPLASIVDGKIFCLHGGIPSSINNQDNSLDAIKQIQCPLKDPEFESAIAWEILWNDPLTSDLNIPLDPMSKKLGFLANSKRGTALFFTNDALNDFLKKNNLSYVVRAHEVQQAGFKVQLGGRLLTVFSSSKYCGGSNEAASVLVDSNKLRLLRLQD